MSNQTGDTLTERPQDAAQNVGALLRARREQLGWSLPDVAVWLKIRLSYLEALEHGQLSRLPGNAYAMGFLRTYATTLGLDPDDLSRRFRTEVREVNRRPELSFPAPVPERGVPAGAIVLLGGLLIVGAYVGWYEFGRPDRAQTHAIPPVPATLLPGPAGKSAPSPQVATVMPGPNAIPSTPAGPSATPVPAGSGTATPAGNAPAAGTEATGAPVAPVAPAPAGPVATASSGAAPGVPAVPAASPAATGTVPATGTPPAASAASPAASSAAPPAPADAPITVHATSRAWIQVRQGGKVAIDRVLEPNQTVDIPAADGPATLTTGNAGGTVLVLGSVTTHSLGHDGAVRRNIPLDRAAIADGSIATEAAPAAPAASSGAAAPASAPAASATSTTPAPTTHAPSPAPTPANGTDASSPPPAPLKPATRVARPRPQPRSDDESSESITERLNAEVVRSHTPH
ncbi:MAG: helix-turn-helix domain-containing protein [Gluconacetobacter diazotrophicus]|nr:helix-turn-helix domain-containing protein [Gluconacetobacter diazotrophicus]